MKRISSATTSSRDGLSSPPMISRSTHGLPCAARPTITAAAPVVASTDCAFAREATSPEAITGTSTSETSSAVSEWSAVPVYICFAERGCSVSEDAPAATSLGPTSRQVREPFSTPRRIFTLTGRETAVATAVSLPVSVKMRRGVENGSRTCLDVGPKLVAAGASSLTLHPRSAKQMYTGTADHSLTAELVSLVDVPVIASGDVASRAKAQSVLATTGAAAVMVGRAAQGNPWVLREIMGGDDNPSREEVVAELILFIRETVRELGEQRANGFLKKFY